ncbi:MAG: choice-of-anchor tandem repeat NxxGxxAF-containing protein, partial [Planctomycetota bacterium]
MRAIPLVVLAALCCSAAVAEPVLTPLLVTGRGGFGVPGATALSFNSLRLDPTGGVAARVILDGAGIDFDNNVAVLAGTGGPMSVVAREGDPVPGVAGATFTNVFALTVAGDVAGVLGRFSGPGVTAADDEALWRYDAGAPTLLARSNEVVPGGTTERFTAFDQIAIDGAGNATVVAATTASNRFRQAIYTDRTGTLQPVFRLGDPVPGTGNKTADLIGALEPAPDSDRVFWAELDSSQSFVDFQSDEVLVRERNGQLSLVLREGVAAPGAPGFEFGEIGGLNGIGGFRPLGGGRIGLRLDLRPAFGSADESAWAFDNGALSLLARTGDVVDGRVVNRVSTPEWISGDSWLIDVSVDGTDDAVLRSDAGTLSTVLATGDAMPDSADTFD